MKRLMLLTGLLALLFVVSGYEFSVLRYPAWGGTPLSLRASPYAELYNEVLAPVVKITSKAGTGSGVIIPCPKPLMDRDYTVVSRTGTPVGRCCFADTYILTAAHVVGDCSEVQVYIYEYGLGVVSIEQAFVIITDTNRDLALLRLKPNTQNTGRHPEPRGDTPPGVLPCFRGRAAKLAPRDYQPYLFTPVWAVGCSLGFPPRPSSGLLSAFSGSYYEISAPILPGNSGGGVFLKDTHQLIGITVWVRVYQGQLITTMVGIVPIHEIYSFLNGTQIKQMNADKTVNGFFSNGEVPGSGGLHFWNPWRLIDPTL